MSYKHIDVDGSTYTYEIGKTHVRITINEHDTLSLLREEVGYESDDDKIRVRSEDIKRIIQEYLQINK